MKNTRILIFCALFAALTAVCAQLIIPMTPVPLSLCTFAVMLCGLLLGWKYGGIAILAYILLGFAGAPVFAGFKNGPALLAGPTAGYLFAYLPYAMICGMPFKRLQDTFTGRALLCVIGTLVCYALGTWWFMQQTGRGLTDSLSLCVLPFLPGDAAKILLASFLTPRLRRAMKNN